MHVRNQEGKLPEEPTHYIAGFSTVVDPENPIEVVIRHVDEAIINWLEKRRAGAKKLAIVYETVPVEESKILDWTLQLVSQEFKYKDLMRNLEIRIVFVEANGHIFKEFQLQPR